MRCPGCSAIVPGEHTPGGPMLCKQCGAKLQISRTRMRCIFLVILLASIALPFLLGFSGWSVAVAGAVAFVCLNLISARIELRFFPPPLEPFDPTIRHWG